MLFDRIEHREPICKGWSADKKHRVLIDGVSYLLRTSPEERFHRALRHYRVMEQAAALNIPMCRPVEFGRCSEGCYMLLTWVDGDDAETVLSRMPLPKQYAYGLDAGAILKKLHTLPAPADAEDWESRFSAKIDRKIAMYESCPIRYPNDEGFLRCLAENRHLLRSRPQCRQHGDYHVGNMMIDRAGTLTIIDFDKDDWGDPWEEFNRIVWCAQASPAFASGMVDGYFDAQVPMEFWRLLAVYICSNTLGSLPWAVDYGGNEVDVMLRQQAEISQWYDGMKKVVPRWYRAH